MNIFILDQNPILNARYHCNKHVSKMILEHVQMLMSSYHLTNNITATNDYNCYKLTHKNHPCTKWTNECIENWCYLLELTKQLNNEFMFRYDHINNHKSYNKICNMIAIHGYPKLKSLKTMTPFAQAMPMQYKDKDPVVAYRNYYLGEKQEIAKWNKKRRQPYWWK